MIKLESFSNRYEKYYHYLLVILLVIQPILDLMWLNDGTYPELLGFTIPTLIRIVMIGIMGLLSLKVIEFNIKHFWIIAYILVIVGYSAVHHYNCVQFQSLVPGNFGYSLLAEMFYILRMVIPVAVIYFVYNSKIDENIFNKCVITIALIMSLSIVIANIFEVAYGSYTDKQIDGNIFDWFSSDVRYVPYQLSSKGFFYRSITSTVMVIIYPYLLLLFTRYKNIRYFLISILVGIALIMIGTKAAAFSPFIESLIVLTGYIFISVIKKDCKFIGVVAFSLVLIVVGNYVLVQNSPVMMKMKYDIEYSETIDNEGAIDPADEDSIDNEMDTIYHEMQTDKPTGDDKDEIIAFFDKYYENLSIKPQFLKESYPYKYDPDFWFQIFDKMEPSQRMQNRVIERMMLDRVKEINNRPLDDVFGIGHSRTANIYNLEKDFIYQYYSLGIVGVIIFLGPYIGILFGAIVVMLIRYKCKFTFENCSFALGIGMALVSAYYSGNTLESLGITIILGAVMGFWLKRF